MSKPELVSEVIRLMPTLKRSVYGVSSSNLVSFIIQENEMSCQASSIDFIRYCVFFSCSIEELC